MNREGACMHLLWHIQTHGLVSNVVSKCPPVEKFGGIQDMPVCCPKQVICMHLLVWWCLMQGNPGSERKYLGSGWPWQNPAESCDGCAKLFQDAGDGSAIECIEDLKYFWQRNP